MTDEQTAGTPEPDDTDAALEQTGGTPETDDRDAGSEEQGPKDDATSEPPHHLKWKADAERLNTLREQYGEDFEAQLARTRTPSPAAREEREAPEDPRKARIREWADKGDPVAAAQLESIEYIEELRGEQQVMRDAVYLQGLPMAERKQVYDEYTRNRGLYRNAADAHERIEKRNLATEVEKLRRENETLKKSVVRDPDVVRTANREHTAKQTQVRKMSGADYDRLVEKTREMRGDNAARALQRQYMEGEIEVKD